MSYNVYKTNMADCLNKLRVYDLNQLCRKFLLPQHGKKVAIVERILEYITDVEREEQIYQFILAIKPSIFEIINGKRINNAFNNSNINNAHSSVHNSTHSSNSGSNKYLSSSNNFFLGSNSGNSSSFCNNSHNLNFANNEILAEKKSGTSPVVRKGKAVKIYQEDSDFSSCACGGMSKNISSKNGIVKCIECNKLQHVSCYVQSPASNKDTESYKILCVACRLKDMDPFYPMKKVLWLKSLTVNSEKLVINASDIKSWKNENKEVIIFCIHLDKKNLSTNISIKQEWPKTFVLKVNGNIIEKVFEPSWEHKRRDSPLKITHTLKTGLNNIDINMTNYETPKLFVVAFLLCKIETEQNIIQHVISKSELNFKDSKERIITILSTKHDDDEVMCMEVNRRISLNCPFALDRIEIPCRGIKCCHIQCFDLKSFIDVTKKTKAFNNRWKCPICSLFLRPKDLIVDMFITYILTQVPKDIKEVELSKSGEIIFNQNNVEGKVVKQIDDVDAATLQKSRVDIKTETSMENIKEYQPAKDNNTFSKNEIIIVDSDPEDNDANNAPQNVNLQKNRNFVQGQQEVICISDSDEEENFNLTPYNRDKKIKEKDDFLIEMENFENSNCVNDFFIRNMKSLEKKNGVPNSHMLFNDMVLDVLNDINKIHVNENLSSNVQNFDAMQKESISELNPSFNEITSDPLLSYYNKPNMLSKDLFFLNSSFDAFGMNPITDISTFAESIYHLHHVEHVDHVDHVDHVEKNHLHMLELAKNGLSTDSCEEEVNNPVDDDGGARSNVEDVDDKGIQTGAKGYTTNGENDEDAPPHGKHDSNTPVGVEHKWSHDNSSVIETDPTLCEDKNLTVLNDIGNVDNSEGNFCLEFEANKSLFDENNLVTNEITTLNNFEPVSNLSGQLNSELLILLQEQNSPSNHNTHITPDTQSRSKRKNKRNKRTNTSENLRKYDSMCSNFNLSLTNYKNKRERAKQLKDMGNGKNGFSQRYCSFSSIHMMNKTDKCVNGGRHSKKINKKNDNFKEKRKTTKEKKK
ncbi:Uncharacterized protein PCOAH_00032870 [Plasmodium coatneyi]|uniref:E3 SUMO-protein ligase PIAS n=1 Tax=Plasmodium coatneyi TaxID=208452 RepID=A0A1B1E2J2_9APIC|nr:Uncharacterized protein PCOAH_00032870 [Plasmodium coatneyi]ANQ09254.1 Uncharacterized protein PCOAH_00032870 [Plasmodium coatneyi]